MAELNDKIEKFILNQKENISKDNWTEFYLNLVEEFISEDEDMIPRTFDWLIGDCKIDIVRKIKFDSSTEEEFRYIFSYCDSITHANISPSTTYLPEGTFSNCRNLRSVNLSRIECIGKFAFCGCVNLEKIKIPESCTAILQEAFKGSGLKKLYLPEHLAFGPYRTDYGIPKNCEVITY